MKNVLGRKNSKCKCLNYQCAWCDWRIMRRSFWPEQNEQEVGWQETTSERWWEARVLRSLCSCFAFNPIWKASVRLWAEGWHDMTYFVKMFLRSLCGLGCRGARVEASRLIRCQMKVAHSSVIAVQGTRKDQVLDIFWRQNWQVYLMDWIKDLKERVSWMTSRFLIWQLEE